MGYLWRLPKQNFYRLDAHPITQLTALTIVQYYVYSTEQYIGQYWDGWPCPGSIPGAGHLFEYITNQPRKANSAVHPSGVSKWVPASAGKAKAGMVHSVSGWMRSVQVKQWDPLRTRAIPERLRGVFMTRRYTNPRLPYLALPSVTALWDRCLIFVATK